MTACPMTKLTIASSHTHQATRLARRSQQQQQQHALATRTSSHIWLCIQSSDTWPAAGNIGWYHHLPGHPGSGLMLLTKPMRHQIPDSDAQPAAGHVIRWCGSFPGCPGTGQPGNHRSHAPRTGHRPRHPAYDRQLVNLDSLQGTSSGGVGPFLGALALGSLGIIAVTPRGLGHSPEQDLHLTGSS